MVARIGVGLIGTGFMGKSHAMAFRAVAGIFEPPVAPDLALVADLDLGAAEAFARRYGFARATDDWRALVEDPSVGLVAVTSPNALHKEMALAAIAAGRHVYCEKPLALSAADAREMAEAAERAGVVAAVGYNYVVNPVIGLARRMIEAGEIGEVIHFRGINDEDYMADPAVPHSWRCRLADAGTGTLGDLGSHLIHTAHHLVGPIAELCADLRTVIAERPLPGGGAAPVENEDQANVLVRFAGGSLGTLASSRVAWGRKNRLAFEINGTKGTLVFDQERMNELHVYQPGGVPGRDGFRTLLAGPAMPPFGNFVPAPGHQLGFGDLKTIEVFHLMRAVAGEAPAFPDFRAGWEVERVLEAIGRSARERRWVEV